MANTYTQIHLHIVFAVQNRVSLISDRWKERLYLYMIAIAANNGHKTLAINGMPDHMHLVLGMRPTQSLSELMQDIKGDSSAWINKSGFVPGRFRWQDGFGAFSCSKTDLPRLIAYVHNQQMHHRKKTFIEEYREILDRSGLEYDQRYLFHEITSSNM
ncbi:MAG: IS200/IS605 family transposase [Chitinophagaceae bacterium]|nr:IS200/IS605 family transposase [Chitinophagaceae bacterium]MBL0055672.1 IS200/IS605 family transposase [Chitinophagaceae bacterium]